ncbi:MAG: NADH-quinone oxidoreductase subunit A [Candidatus Omnitrophica bacterium]|nr:NADH-quinone oxidoreductase subunit A [Candidatus Omnitrophota bacterium]
MNEAILIFTVIFSALIITTLLGLHILLASQHPTPVKEEPFECGKDLLSRPKGRMSVRFYITAMLFLLFDIEIIFLYPWAVLFQEMGMAGFLQMLVFVTVLMAGFFYAWKKGALKWG